MDGYYVNLRGAKEKINILNTLSCTSFKRGLSPFSRKHLEIQSYLVAMLGPILPY